MNYKGYKKKFEVPFIKITTTLGQGEVRPSCRQFLAVHFQADGIVNEKKRLRWP